MSSYNKGNQVAAKVFDLVADGTSKVTAGTKIKATSSTTAVVAHGLGSTPDFILATAEKSIGVKAAANTTSITFTVTTAATSNGISYIAGYTA
jgi:hypothetical protein